MSEMTDFLMEKTKPLRESLAIPLPENNDPQSLKELKKLASYAESQRANLAVMKRRVDVVVEERRNEIGAFIMVGMRERKDQNSPLVSCISC